MIRHAITLLVACTMNMPLLAEVVRVPAGQQAADKQSIEKPRRGISKAKVETTMGAPLHKNGPVGDPPISSWEYDDYIVYFEYDKVLHTVLKGSATPAQ